MKKQLEQFALEIERHGETLPRGQLAIGSSGLGATLARTHYTTIGVAPGIRFRCIADAEATDRLAAKIRKAKIPKHRKPSGAAGRDETADMARAEAYGLHILKSGLMTVTLWPPTKSENTDQARFEYRIMATILGMNIPKWNRPRRAELISRLEDAGYTIRYADADHWKECGEVRIAA